MASACACVAEIEWCMRAEGRVGGLWHETDRTTPRSVTTSAMLTLASTKHAEMIMWSRRPPAVSASSSASSSRLGRGASLRAPAGALPPPNLGEARPLPPRPSRAAGDETVEPCVMARELTGGTIPAGGGQPGWTSGTSVPAVLAVECASPDLASLA